MNDLETKVNALEQQVTMLRSMLNEMRQAISALEDDVLPQPVFQEQPAITFPWQLYKKSNEDHMRIRPGSIFVRVLGSTVSLVSNGWYHDLIADESWTFNGTLPTGTDWGAVVVRVYLGLAPNVYNTWEIPNWYLVEATGSTPNAAILAALDVSSDTNSTDPKAFFQFVIGAWNAKGVPEQHQFGVINVELSANELFGQYEWNDGTNTIQTVDGRVVAVLS